jgi:dihydrofolate reductase
VRFFQGDAAKIVANLKRETEKDIYLFGSADLTANLLPDNAFDEIRIGLSPHILGAGTPLFKPTDTRLRLKLLEAKPFSSGITILRYQPTA